MKKTMKYIFGPVPSRRFGRSLGVDLVPFKTCTQNCVFCQLGPTPQTTAERKPYVPMDMVINELRSVMQQPDIADVVTLSGSGEPTLHTQFGDVLTFVKNETDIHSVLLTNGTLLYLKEVREQAVSADIVKITLSAWDQASYSRIHRPHPDTSFQRLINGERTFRQMYSASLWVEVFLLEGINTAEDEIKKLAKLVHSLHPDKIHLNTAVRPPADPTIQIPSSQRLTEIKDYFGETADIVCNVTTPQKQTQTTQERDVIDLIKRHPCTIQQLSDITNLSAERVLHHMKSLSAQGLISIEERDETIWCSVLHDKDKK